MKATAYIMAGITIGLIGMTGVAGYDALFGDAIVKGFAALAFCIYGLMALLGGVTTALCFDSLAMRTR